MYNELASGATFIELKLFVLRDMMLPFPPLALQEEFASKIEAIEKQKELIKQSIQETETLFNSRMDYYFN
jgi:type I restriction enzyme S subunit